MSTTRKLLWTTLLVFLLLSVPFLVRPVYNNVKNHQFLKQMLSIELPNETRLVKSSHYISSNRGDCVHFIGLLLYSSLPIQEFTKHWQSQHSTLYPNSIDIIWKPYDRDMITLIQSELTQQEISIPVNLPFYGSDVNSGINELLFTAGNNTETTRNHYIVFTTLQEPNLFDFRCY